MWYSITEKEIYWKQSRSIYCIGDLVEREQKTVKQKFNLVRGEMDLL